MNADSNNILIEVDDGNTASVPYAALDGSHSVYLAPTSTSSATFYIAFVDTLESTIVNRVSFVSTNVKSARLTVLLNDILVIAKVRKSFCFSF